MSNIVKYNIDDFEKNITQNFKVKEFACKDNTQELYIDIDFVKEKLQAIREYKNKPIKIISGYRTQSYNQKCGGAKNSKHLTGEAIDFAFLDDDIMNIENIFYLANDINNNFKIKRIGIYINRNINYLHIDNGQEPLIWVNDFKLKKQSYYNNVYDYLLDKQPIKVSSYE